jgi:ABC-2 type transport system ATP-binding protein
METMIAVQDLTKYYGLTPAISRLSFEVGKGEIVGFLGPNGAGKTTTLKILAGFLSPTSGAARINGHDCVTESLAVRRSLGYLPETAPLYNELSVSQFLRFAAFMKLPPVTIPPFTTTIPMESAGCDESGNCNP